MWKLGLTLRNSFSGNICFKFSALCLCSVAVNSQRNMKSFARRTKSGRLKEAEAKSSLHPRFVQIIFFRRNVQVPPNSQRCLLSAKRIIVSAFCRRIRGGGGRGGECSKTQILERENPRSGSYLLTVTCTAEDMQHSSIGS
jgi:hypothetical protein